MARLRDKRLATGQRIAVIDDDVELAESTRQLLASDGHEVRIAHSPSEGVALIRDWRPDLLLLDYYMPGGTGATVVREIRQFDQLCQVLLVTGYASEQPARKLLAELDIQGYHDKSDGPQRLLVLVDAALKHGRALRQVDRQRSQLRYILDASPDIMRLQPIRELLASSLTALGGLIRCGTGLLATENHGLFLLDEPGEGVSIHASIGDLADATSLHGLPSEVRAVVEAGLASTVPHHDARGYVLVPLRTRNNDRGCMVLQGDELPIEAIEACAVYAQQVVQAFENVLLYERATVDPLTNLFNRGYGLQRLDETLRLGGRTQTPTGLLLLDLDHFKEVNDRHGHPAGDLVLRAVARVVREALRTSDIVFRYGGEEFVVVLPATDAPGSQYCAERVRQAIEAHAVTWEGVRIPSTASLGVAVAEPGDLDLDVLLRSADRALYEAKHRGRNQVCCSPSASVAA